MHEINDKIQMIKSIRFLTIILGQLGIKCLTHQHMPPYSLIRSIPKAYYGIDLLDAKYYTERFLSRKA